MYFLSNARKWSQEVFSHKSQASPNSLLEKGHLWSAKSMFIIVKCIEEGHDFHQQECLEVYSKVYDGVALKKMLQPINWRTFDDFIEIVVMVYIKNQLHSVKRIYILGTNILLTV